MQLDTQKMLEKLPRIEEHIAGTLSLEDDRDQRRGARTKAPQAGVAPRGQAPVAHVDFKKGKIK